MNQHFSKEKCHGRCGRSSERNPFRYRGYYYDAETGWYYLQSRYYDPEVKRFINADTPDLLTNDCMNLMQYNMFMYCNGDPVNGIDPSGHVDLLTSYIAFMCLQSLITGNTLSTSDDSNNSMIATSIGGVANITYGLSHSASLQIYKDQFGNVALQFSYGNGVGGGVGISIGAFESIFPYIKGIEETEKYGIVAGGSGVCSGGLGADLILSGEGNDMHPIGASFSINEGAAAEGHVIMSYTKTIFKINLFEQVNRVNRCIRRGQW